MLNPLGVIAWHIVEGVVLPAKAGIQQKQRDPLFRGDDTPHSTDPLPVRPEGPGQCPFRQPSLFGEASDYTSRLKSRIKRSVSIEGVRHVPQRGNHGRFVCRHAVLKSIRDFLINEKGLSREHVRALKLYNAANDNVTTTKGEWPWRYSDALCPTPGELDHVMDIIDAHLDNGLPAMVYVRHPRGVHVVEVKERIAKRNGTYEYIFYDPGTRQETKREGRFIYDPVAGTYIKRGSMRRRGAVVEKQYALFGVFDYRSRIEERLNPRVAER